MAQVEGPTRQQRCIFKVCWLFDCQTSNVQSRTETGSEYTLFGDGAVKRIVSIQPPPKVVGPFQLFIDTRYSLTNYQAHPIAALN